MEAMMESTREYNYDWLRVVSMIAVIMIHVSSSWVHGFSTYISDGGGRRRTVISDDVMCV